MLKNATNQLKSTDLPKCALDDLWPISIITHKEIEIILW